jgi:hypothetical protein
MVNLAQALSGGSPIHDPYGVTKPQTNVKRILANKLLQGGKFQPRNGQYPHSQGLADLASTGLGLYSHHLANQEDKAYRDDQKKQTAKTVSEAFKFMSPSRKEMPITREPVGEQNFERPFQVGEIGPDAQFRPQLATPPAEMNPDMTGTHGGITEENVGDIKDVPPDMLSAAKTLIGNPNTMKMGQALLGQIMQSELNPKRDPIADHKAKRKYDIENPLPTKPHRPSKGKETRQIGEKYYEFQVRYDGEGNELESRRLREVPNPNLVVVGGVDGDGVVQHKVVDKRKLPADADLKKGQKNEMQKEKTRLSKAGINKYLGMIKDLKQGINMSVVGGVGKFNRALEIPEKFINPNAPAPASRWEAKRKFLETVITPELLSETRGISGPERERIERLMAGGKWLDTQGDAMFSLNLAEKMLREKLNAYDNKGANGTDYSKMTDEELMKAYKESLP